MAGRWFSPGTPVSPTDKSGDHDIAEILLKMALNTIFLTFLKELGIKTNIIFIGNIVEFQEKTFISHHCHHCKHFICVFTVYC